MNHSLRYGNYQLLKLIGKGGYGEVYLVEDISTKHQYAMKILDKAKIANENLENEVLSEVRSMKLVQHPYIVRLFGVMKTNKKILLIMEYIEGGDLFEAIKSEINDCMIEEKARLIFQQIINAVQYLHNKNIIHRDLKPENILIDKKSNCIKITDFGLSALIKKRDQILPDIAGTIDYLAPEVIKQSGYLGQSADIWSCGVILYNCVTGNKPFVGKNSVMVNNIVAGNVEYPYNKLSNSIIDLLKRILDPNPLTRYTIEQIVKHEWVRKGYDIVENYVNEFIEKNIEEENENVNGKKDRQLSKKVEYTNKEEFSFDLNEIPVISCFEFGLILYGRAVGKMFDGNKEEFNDTKNFKFICRKGVGVCCDVIKKFFASQRADVNFTKIDIDKVIINVIYKQSVLRALLQVFKFSNANKCMYILSYQNGAKSDYFKLMNNFFIKNKEVIEKF